MMRKFIIIMLTCILLLTSCGVSGQTGEESSILSEEITTEEAHAPKPETNNELFEYVISKWKQNGAADLYEYADSEIRGLLSETDFVYLFDSVSALGGDFNDVSDTRSSTSDGITVYTADLDFDNLHVEVSVGIKNLMICSFYHNIHFKNSFEIKHDGFTERYFILENDGCRLNAVYTYADSDLPRPAVLLIPGSGLSDYNATVGILTPFEDIARGLAKNGINSLRIDKRTLNYSENFGTECGIDEEYLRDLNAAVDFLRKQQISGLYLLGHSLGGQIATELAVRDGDIDGLILFNTSARHLADIARDQYSAIDPANSAVYNSYAEAAKNALDSSARGYYYYGASDHYWASYNKIDVPGNIKNADLKTLIINSTYDNQIFESDIDLWKQNFSDNDKITIRIFDDISHFGYKIDMADESAMYKRTDFPDEIIMAFFGFINS